MWHQYPDQPEFLVIDEVGPLFRWAKLPTMIGRHVRRATDLEKKVMLAKLVAEETSQLLTRHAGDPRAEGLKKDLVSLRTTANAIYTAAVKEREEKRLEAQAR